MIELATFLLVAFGVVYVLTESVLFASPRIWLASRGVMLEVLVYCALCTGFWAGVALELVFAYEWSVQALLVAPVLSGTLVMGAISVLRAFAPADFLQGAWERERPLIEILRQRRQR